MQKTIVKFSGCFIFASLIFLGCVNSKKEEKMLGENEIPKYNVFVKDGYRHFEPKFILIKKLGVGKLFPVPQPNAIGSLDYRLNAITIIEFDDSKERVSKRIVAKNFSKYVVGDYIYRFSPNFSDDMIVYSKTRIAVIANIKTGEAFHAGFDIDSDDDFMHGIRFLNPENNTFVVVKTIDILKNSADATALVDNLHIAKLEGRELADLGEVISGVEKAMRISPDLPSFNRWVVHDRKLIAYDNSDTKEMLCFDGVNKTTHPFAEVFNRNKDKIYQDEWGWAFRDFAIHPELPFGLVISQLPDEYVNALHLVRWDIDDPDEQFTLLNPKLLPLTYHLGIERMALAYPSFSPDGKWFVVGYYEYDLFRSPNLIAIPVSQKSSEFLNIEELVILGSTKEVSSINWTTAPTALVVSSEDVFGIRKWDLGELHNARVVEVQGDGDYWDGE